jgi:hypothetical protein
MPTYKPKLVASAQRYGTVADVEENLRRIVEVLGGDAYEDGVAVSYPGGVTLEALKLGTGLGNEWKAEPYSYFTLQIPLSNTYEAAPTRRFGASGGAGVFLPDISTATGKVILVGAYLYLHAAPGAVTCTAAVKSAAGDLATFTVAGLTAPTITPKSAAYVTGTLADPTGTLDDSTLGNGFYVEVTNLAVAGGTVSDVVEGLTVQLVFKVQHVS